MQVSTEGFPKEAREFILSMTEELLTAVQDDTYRMWRNVVTNIVSPSDGNPSLPTED